MQEGKAKQDQEIDGRRKAPLHLVLLEEPEAHLHMQVQQVFIRRRMEYCGTIIFLRVTQTLLRSLLSARIPAI